MQDNIILTNRQKVRDIFMFIATGAFVFASLPLIIIIGLIGDLKPMQGRKIAH